jgi:hypothetical protein
MRLYPPAWAIGRRALEDHELGGFRLPAGAILMLSPFVTQRDPRWYPERPAVRSGALHAGSAERTPALRLLAVRRRCPPVHRGTVRSRGAGARASCPATGWSRRH